MSKMSDKAAESLEAAAPDLLAACEFALEYLRTATTHNFERGGHLYARRRLKAAIEKAHAL